LNMVFFMVSTLEATAKPAPILDFCGLFTIEWERGVTGYGQRQRLS